jgi:lipopolysaccharide biosynthesis protein
MSQIAVELKQSYQVEPDDGGPGWWQATGMDPQFFFNCADGPLQTGKGHYTFEIESDEKLHGFVNPCLYVDAGQGLNGNDKVDLLFHHVSGTTYRCYFTLFSDVQFIRFDPTELRTRFHIGAIRLTKMSRIGWYLSAAKLIGAARKRSGGSMRTVVDELVIPLRNSGVKGAAAKLRSTISMPLFEGAVVKTAGVARPSAQDISAGGESSFLELYLNQSMVTEGYKHPSFSAGRAHTTDASKCDVKLICYYLPQFHPFPENDTWWGKGFTEWTNVTKALPRFVGHYQPKFPSDLGYYDLRNVDVMREQAALARKFGITGFCFHFYWFGGKRLMETPILNFREAEDIDLEYSLCWANENWSRRWDGAEHEMLIGQVHSAEDDIAFITYVSRYFSDKRYIKIDGKPVLTVYRPDILPDPQGTVNRWRKAVREMGFPDLFLVATTAFGFTDYAGIGFDALSEFPPHAIRANDMAGEVTMYDQRFAGVIYSYDSVVSMQMGREYPKGVVFPGVMPAWDNVARRPLAGHVFHNSTPSAYRAWLRSSADRARENEPGQRMIFINAWNEWAEGAYLEPDRMYGHAYLWATASVIDELSEKPADMTAYITAHNRKFTANGKYAIAAHLFYTDMIDIIASIISVPKNIDVYFTVPFSVDKSTVDTIISIFPRSYIMMVENCGRDILPFIKILALIRKNGYDWVCKLHGKKSVHLGEGNLWRDQLFQSLLGGLRLSGTKVVHPKLPKTSAIGIVGPRNSFLMLDDHSTRVNNVECMQILLGRLGISAPAHTGSFVAGSMFWFRPAALDKVLKAKLKDDDFGIELGRIDGTPAHAMERLFGIIAADAGYSMAELSDGQVTATIQAVAPR